MIRRLWLLPLLCVLACSQQEAETPPDPGVVADDTTEERPGRWRRLKKSPEQVLTAEQKQRILRLESLGYAGGTTQGRAGTGVVVHDPELSAPGLNFYTSGHGPEAILMDAEGTVLHRWRREFREVWPDLEIAPAAEGAQHWRRARPLRDGSLLVIWEGLGIMKLDARSNVVWAAANGAHHDLEVQPDGDILVLTREGRMLPEFDADDPVLEEFIVHMSPDGEERWRISLLRAFLDTPEAKRTLRRRYGGPGDILHTNSLELLDGRIAADAPAFAAGNVLISCRNPSVVAVIDPEDVRVAWMLKSKFRHQHDATIRGDGDLMFFDNLGQSEASAVRIYDPGTRKLLSLLDQADGEAFYSYSCSTCQELPGGTLLITESDQGRAFEMTPEGRVVWDFRSPHRAGEEGEFVATLFELLRLPADFPVKWGP